MKLDLKKLCATAVAAAMAASVALPAAAAPMFTPKAPEPVVEIQKVQNKEWRRPRDRDRNRDWRRGDRGDWGKKRFVRRGDGYYFNGHRGYRNHRPGYREYNGWWFPAAAFLAGAVISGAIQNQGPVYRSGNNAHVQWCYDRYRSYRASDNTFQPYNGPRQQCYSPYS